MVTKDELIRYPIVQKCISEALHKLPHINSPYVLNHITVHLELFDDMVVQSIFYNGNIIITNKYRVNLSTFNIPLLTIAMVDDTQYIRSADAETNTNYTCPICHNDVFLLGKYFIHYDTPSHTQNKTDIKRVERDYKHYQYKHKYITPHIVDSNNDPYPDYKSQNPELYHNLLIEISSQLLRNNTKPKLDTLNTAQLEMFKKLYERNSCLHYADNIKNYSLLVTPIAIYLYSQKNEQIDKQPFRE